MAMKIGELFVALGFDVDDTKLKTFNNTVNDTFNGLVKFAGITASAAGMYEIAKGANESAISMKQLNDQFKISYELQQKFAGQWAFVNPGGGSDEGLKILGNIAKYSSGMPYGLTGQEYLRFNGALPSDDPSRMVKVMREGLKEMVDRYGVGQTTNLVSAIAGDPRMMSYLQTKQDELEIAGKMRDITQEQLENTQKEAQAVGNLKSSWDNFFNHVVASLAPGAVPVLRAFGEKGVKAGVNATGEQYGGWTDYINPFWWADQTMGAFGVDSGYIPGTQTKKSAGGAAGKGFWQSQGYSDSAAAAWRAQEMAESGGNPGARNKGHFGLFQWDAARRAKILAGTGIDVANSSADDQRRAAAWEAQQMGIPSGLSGLSAYDASQYLSHKYEMHEARTSHGDEADYRARMAQDMAGDTTNNVTITVQSSADAKEVAEAVHQRFLDVTYPTLNQGGF